MKFPPCHPRCNCSVTPILVSDEQPETWGTTLDQPAPATEEEQDTVTSELMRQYEEIWQESNKPWVSKSMRVRTKAVAIPRFNHFRRREQT